MWQSRKDGLTQSDFVEDVMKNHANGTLESIKYMERKYNGCL